MPPNLKVLQLLSETLVNDDTSLLVIRRVSSTSTASPSASRPVVVAVAAVVDVVRCRIEKVGDGSKNVKLSSG